MVCPGGIALSLSDGTSITIDIPFAEAVLFGWRLSGSELKKTECERRRYTPHVTPDVEA